MVRLRPVWLWHTLRQSTSAWRRPTATLHLGRRTCWCMCPKEPNVWDAYRNHTQIAQVSRRLTQTLLFTLIVMPSVTAQFLYSFAAQWHHIENLDLFFQRISFKRKNVLLYKASLKLWNYLSDEHKIHLKMFLNSDYVYNLHQKNGFTCMLLGEIFELV